MIKPVFPGWDIGDVLGRGGFSTVYAISRDNFGHRETAALKYIRIPQSSSDIEELRCSGLDDSSIGDRFRSYVDDIVREYDLMYTLKGHPNVVICDDLKCIQQDNGLGWDICIRMEQLVPLSKMNADAADPERLAIRVGRDICKALDICKKNNILHRDIKPQNIFYSEQHKLYKLGDFGISKVAEKTSSGTRAGTPRYMAPEVYKHEAYGHQSDIYSLGMVLYWLLNKRRLPFEPLPPEVPTSSLEQEAFRRRISGEKLSAPALGSEELKAIVLKACAYDPRDRYANAREMLKALMALPMPQKTQTIPEKKSVEQRPDQSPLQNTPEDVDGTLTMPVFDPAPAAMPEDVPTIGIFGPDTTPGFDPVPAVIPEEDHNIVASPSPDRQQKKHQREADRRLKQKRKRLLKIMLYVSIALLVVVLAIIVLLTIREKESPEPGETTEETLSSADLKDSQPTETTVFLCYHIWRPATCLEPETCITCGETRGGLGPHQPTTATCLKESVCKVCNTTLSGLGDHLYDDTPLGYRYCVYCYKLHTPGLGMVAAGAYHTAYLNSDGLIVGAGNGDGGQTDFDGWYDTIFISASEHTVGLRSDGSVCAAGDNSNGECQVTHWRNIIEVRAGRNHTVALNSDGRVVWTGLWDERLEETSSWQNIVGIAVSDKTIYGLRSDGTVLSAG